MCVIYSELVYIKCAINTDYAIKCYLTHIQSQIFLQLSRCLPVLQAQYTLLLLITSIYGTQSLIRHFVRGDTVGPSRQCFVTHVNKKSGHEPQRGLDAKTDWQTVIRKTALTNTQRENISKSVPFFVVKFSVKPS
jgi:hypothetical protein